MSDTPSPSPPAPTPLTDQALARLRKLADGNGFAPDAIKLFGSEERLYTIKGMSRLMPYSEPQPQTAGKSAGGKNRKILPNFAAMRAEIEQQVTIFGTRSDWVPAALKELQAKPSGGWGLNEEKIPLPDYTMYFSASEPCTACRGQKMVACESCNGHGYAICSLCNGNRYETCPACQGFGYLNGQQDQPCMTCSNSPIILNGFRCVTCHKCNGSGQMVCPTCNGRRGTTCPTCKGVGTISENVTLVCGFEPRFTIAAEGLPSGLRRGLDRLGIAKLGNGHADIAVVAPPPAAEDTQPESDNLTMAEEDARQSVARKTPQAEQHYEAQIPYADMRMDFAGKKALVSVFGKRGVLLGVPAFLDTAAETAREALRAAAKGKAHLSAALSMRLMRDALTLVVAGQYDAKNLRKIYPYGLSAQTAQEIISEMHLALKSITRLVRGVVATSCGIASGGLFWMLFATPFGATFRRLFPMPFTPVADFAPLLIALLLSWIVLSVSTSVALRRQFKGLKINALQKTGKTGYAMMGSIITLFFSIAILAPNKPNWLVLLLRNN